MRKFVRYQKHKENHRSVSFVRVWVRNSQDVSSLGMLMRARWGKPGVTKQRKVQQSIALICRQWQIQTPSALVGNARRPPPRLHCIQSPLMSRRPFSRGQYISVWSEKQVLWHFLPSCLFSIPVHNSVDHKCLAVLSFVCLKGDDSHTLLFQSSFNKT